MGTFRVHLANSERALRAGDSLTLYESRSREAVLRALDPLDDPAHTFVVLWERVGTPEERMAAILDHRELAGMVARKRQLPAPQPQAPPLN